MKKRIIFGLLGMILAASSVRATVDVDFTSGSSVGSIPQGSPLGAVFGGTVSTAPLGSTVAGLTVSLNISGGYNGNLYAYLVAPNGTMVVLLNQPGTGSGSPFGAPGSGFGSTTPGVYNFTLSDSASTSIQSATETPGMPVTGSYQAAGTLASFDGSAADGTWELFFADMVSGGGASNLNSWQLGITAVPEPVGLGLGIFGGLLALWASLKVCWKKPEGQNNEREDYELETWQG